MVKRIIRIKKGKLGIKIHRNRTHCQVSYLFIRVFHKLTKLAILALLQTLYTQYIWSFRPYLQNMTLVKTELNIRGRNEITFQGCRLYL